MKLLIDLNLALVDMWFNTRSGVKKFFLGIVMWLIGLILLPLNFICGIVYVMRYMGKKQAQSYFFYPSYMNKTGEYYVNEITC